MMHKSIPLWRDANTLLLEVEKSVRHFPCYHKYTLGAEMRKQAMWVCYLINRAFMGKESKLDIVKGLVTTINDLKLQIQLAKELQVFRNFAEFERLSTLAVQSGKDSGLNKLRKLTQNFCFRLDDLKRRIVILCNDFRSSNLGQKGKLCFVSYLLLSSKQSGGWLRKLQASAQPEVLRSNA